MSVQKKGSLWEATAVVTIVDQNGLAVSGATVSVSWTLNGGSPFKTDSKATGTSGVATFRSGRVGVSGDIITIAVTGVVKAGASYNSGANAETTDFILVP